MNAQLRPISDKDLNILLLSANLDQAYKSPKLGCQMRLTQFYWYFSPDHFRDPTAIDDPSAGFALYAAANGLIRLDPVTWANGSSETVATLLKTPEAIRTHLHAAKRPETQLDRFYAGWDTVNRYGHYLAILAVILLFGALWVTPQIPRITQSARELIEILLRDDTPPDPAVRWGDVSTFG